LDEANAEEKTRQEKEKKNGPAEKAQKQSKGKDERRGAKAVEEKRKTKERKSRKGERCWTATSGQSPDFMKQIRECPLQPRALSKTRTVLGCGIGKSASADLGFFICEWAPIRPPRVFLRAVSDSEPFQYLKNRCRTYADSARCRPVLSKRSWRAWERFCLRVARWWSRLPSSWVRL